MSGNFGFIGTETRKTKTLRLRRTHMEMKLEGQKMEEKMKEMERKKQNLFMELKQYERK